jgi:hypothetical protein
MLDEKDIDNIFRNSLGNAEVEPSEGFWNKANESIMEREGIAYQSRNTGWRNAAVLLGLLVFGLIGYSAYITNKVDKLGQQVSNIQSNMVLASAQQHAATSIANNDNGSVTQSGQQNVSASVMQSAKTVSANGSMNNTSEAIASNSSRTAHSNSGYMSSSFEKSVAQGYYDRNYITMLGSTSAVGNEFTLATPERTTMERPGSAMAQLIMDNSDNISKPDSINRYSKGNNAPIGQKISTSRISVSAYVTPQVAQGNFSTSEKEQLAYTAGVNAGYDLTKNKDLTLTLGVNYQSYSYALNRSTVYGTATDIGQVFQVVTSSGPVYVGQLSKAGNTAVASGTGNRSYLGIPVELKYYYHSNRKFGMYVVGGGAVNVNLSNNVSAYCQNLAGNEAITVNNITGTSPLIYSYKVGMGAKYIVGNGFSVYAEPSWTGSINPVNTASPVKAYSDFLNVSAGISYHF